MQENKYIAFFVCISQEEIIDVVSFCVGFFCSPFKEINLRKQQASGESH